VTEIINLCVIQYIGVYVDGDSRLASAGMWYREETGLIQGMIVVALYMK